MALVREDKTKPDGWPALSPTPYLLDLDEATFCQQGDDWWWWTIPGLWLGRKNGRTTLTMGEVRVYRNGPGTGLDAMMARADGRYGGNWHAKWDGQKLLVDPNQGFSPKAQVALADRLDNLLQGLPAIPDGYTGWWRYR